MEDPSSKGGNELRAWSSATAFSMAGRYDSIRRRSKVSTESVAQLKRLDLVKGRHTIEADLACLCIRYREITEGAAARSVRVSDQRHQPGVSLAGEQVLKLQVEVGPACSHRSKTLSEFRPPPGRTSNEPGSRARRHRREHIRRYCPGRGIRTCPWLSGRRRHWRPSSVSPGARLEFQRDPKRASGPFQP